LGAVLGLVVAGCAGRNAEEAGRDFLPGHVYTFAGGYDFLGSGIPPCASGLRKRSVRVREVAWWGVSGVREEIVAGTRHSGRSPLCFVAVSSGVDAALGLARDLKGHGIQVDLLVAMEEWTSSEVPSNVCRVVWIHKRDSVLYFEEMDGVRGCAAQLRDVDLRMNPWDNWPSTSYHMMISADPRVHAIVIEEVLAVFRRKAGSG
jgi:hypothetical protein